MKIGFEQKKYTFVQLVGLEDRYFYIVFIGTV